MFLPPLGLWNGGVGRGGLVSCRSPAFVMVVAGVIVTGLLLRLSMGSCRWGVGGAPGLWRGWRDGVWVRECSVGRRRRWRSEIFVLVVDVGQGRGGARWVHGCMLGADAEEAHWTCLERAGLVAGERGYWTEKEEEDMVDEKAMR